MGCFLWAIGPKLYLLQLQLERLNRIKVEQTSLSVFFCSMRFTHRRAKPRNILYGTVWWCVPHTTSSGSKLSPSLPTTDMPLTSRIILSKEFNVSGLVQKHVWATYLCTIFLLWPFLNDQIRLQPQKHLLLSTYPTHLWLAALAC